MMLGLLNLRQKFFLLLTLLLLLVAIVIATQWQVNQANVAIQNAYQTRYESTLLANELRHSSDDLTRMVRTYTVTGEPIWKEHYQEVARIRAGEQPRPQGYEGIYWDFRAADMPVSEHTTEQISLLDMMQRAGFTDKELELLAQANQRSNELTNLESEALLLTDELARNALDQLLPNQPDQLRAMDMVHGRYYHHTKAEIMVLINQFFEALIERTNTNIADAKATAAQWRWVQWLSSGIALLVFFVLLYTIFTQIIRALGRVVTVMDTIAQGDLTQSVSIEGKDETAQLASALTQMQTSLQQIVASVRSSSNSIATAASQISAGTHDLASRTEQQSSALAETAATMEEITATIKLSADNVHEASDLAHSSNQTATENGQSVLTLVKQMEDLNSHAKKVAEITELINTIAFQTNILALNAAVEAARAGEQGRGFAVVASEVRGLAQRAASAAKDIQTLIDQSVSATQVGSNQAQKVGSGIEALMQRIQSVSNLMNEIDAASREQSTGVEQVNIAMSQMDDVTRQNASLVEESAAASSSLREQAEHLAHLVAVFKLDDPSHPALTPPPATW